jgi:type VII secretion integral membrane protein EccD
LLPTLLFHTGEQVIEAGAAHGGWALQRLGEPPFDIARSAAAVGLMDGDVVYFQPRAQALPELVFDDPVDGMGTVLREQTRRWDAAATRRAATAALALLPLAAIGGLLRTGPGWTAAAKAAAGHATWTVPATAAGTAALLLLLAAWGLSWAADDGAAGAAAGLAAVPYAGLSGLFATLGSHPLSHTGAAGLSVAAACSFAASVLAAVLIGGRHGTHLLVAAIPAFVIGLAALGSLQWNPAGCAALASALTLAATTMAPRAAYAVARLPRAAVATSRADLLNLSVPIPAADIGGKSLAADRFLTAALGGCALAVAATAAFSLTGPGWTPPVLVAVTALLLALRARPFGGFAQRWWLLGAALASTAVLAWSLPAHLGSAMTGAGVAIGAAGLLAAAVGPFALNAERRPAPPWARVGDLLELAGVAAALPLALLILGTFGYLRSLAG